MDLVRPSGIIPDSFTAFSVDFSLDEERFAAHISWLATFDVIDMLTIFGGSGEGYALTLDEFARGVSTATRVCEPRVKVIVNIHAESYEKAAEKIRIACREGASAVRVQHPYYARYDPDSLFDYYSQLAREFSETSMIVYADEAATGRPFPIETLAKVAHLDNVVGIKLSSHSFGDLFRLDVMTEAADCLLLPNSLQSFYYFCRSGIQSVASIDGPLPQVVPDVCQDYFLACCSEDWDAAMEGLRVLARVRSVVAPSAENFPAGPKCAMELLGRSVGPARRPKRMPGSVQVEQMRKGLSDLGLLEPNTPGSGC